MKLYFQHANGDLEYIEDVDDERYISAALADLGSRAPHFKSYYQRTWTDDNGWTWIDVGDHYCFYIVKGD